MSRFRRPTRIFWFSISRRTSFRVHRRASRVRGVRPSIMRILIGPERGLEFTAILTAICSSCTQVDAAALGRRTRPPKEMSFFGVHLALMFQPDDLPTGRRKRAD